MRRWRVNLTGIEVEYGIPSTPGMTTVGVASLFIIQEQLRGFAGANCNGNQTSPEIDKGLNWLAGHMDQFATTNVYTHYYPFATLYAFERVGAATGLRYLGNVDLVEKGAEFAINLAGCERLLAVGRRAAG